jgi:hypothetical protein
MIVGRGIAEFAHGLFVVMEDPRSEVKRGAPGELASDVRRHVEFVHPRGAVTEKGGERRFHAIGEPLQNCQPLTESDQPVVYHDLLKLEARMAGINRGPGLFGWAAHADDRGLDPAERDKVKYYEGLFGGPDRWR